MTKVEMPDAMKQDVLGSATRAFTRYNSTRDIAQYIKFRYSYYYQYVNKDYNMTDVLLFCFVTNPAMYYFVDSHWPMRGPNI
jgi:hypothetical protein